MLHINNMSAITEPAEHLRNRFSAGLPYSHENGSHCKNLRSHCPHHSPQVFGIIGPGYFGAPKEVFEGAPSRKERLLATPDTCHLTEGSPGDSPFGRPARGLCTWCIC